MQAWDHAVDLCLSQLPGLAPPSPLLRAPGELHGGYSAQLAPACPPEYVATAFLADVALAGGAVIRVEHVESIAITKPLPSSQNAQQTTQDVLITSVLLWILIGIGVVVLLCLLAFTLACVRR